MAHRERSVHAAAFAHAADFDEQVFHVLGWEDQSWEQLTRLLSVRPAGVDVLASSGGDLRELWTGEP